MESDSTLPCISSDSNCSLRTYHTETDTMNADESTSSEQTIMLWICVVGYIISTVLCLGSLFVFRHFTKLHCLRNLIHVNFIACIATHNICWLILFISLSFGLEICVLTQILFGITKFCVTSTFCWMLCEGLYLYLSILYPLHTHHIKYYMCAAIGWGLPFTLSAQSIWNKLIMAPDTNLHRECIDDEASLDRLTVLVLIVIIITNAIILLAVIYVLFTKFRQVSDKEWATLRHIFRALLFLCPLLGINYIVTIYHPENPKWLSSLVAFYSLIINAFQGSFISVFFCFNHEEVRACLRRSIILNQNCVSTKNHGSIQRRSIEESQMTFLDSRL